MEIPDTPAAVTNELIRCQVGFGLLCTYVGNRRDATLILLENKVIIFLKEIYILSVRFYPPLICMHAQHSFSER